MLLQSSITEDNHVREKAYRYTVLSSSPCLPTVSPHSPFRSWICFSFCMTITFTKYFSCIYAILGLGAMCCAGLRDVLKLSERSIFPYRKFLISYLTWKTSKCCHKLLLSTVWAAMKKANSMPARLGQLHELSAAFRFWQCLLLFRSLACLRRAQNFTRDGLATPQY